MKDEIDYEHARFTQEFKVNDKFNLNKFMQQKQKLRELNQTYGLEESIAEQIFESVANTDVKTQSYIESQIGLSQSGKSALKGPPLTQNFMAQQQKQQKHFENDPLSLINLFVKKTAAPPPVVHDQMVPELSLIHI